MEFHLLDFLKPYGLCLAALFIGLALPAMSVLEFSGHIAARLAFAVVCCLAGIALFALGTGYSLAAPDPAYSVAPPDPVRAALIAAVVGAIAATTALSVAIAVHIRRGATAAPPAHSPKYAPTPAAYRAPVNARPQVRSWRPQARS